MIQDVEAERAVLGAVMALASEGASKAVVDSTGPLPPEAFTESRRFVWEAILALAGEGQAVDSLTLAERLGARRQLAAAGGASGLLDFDKALPLEPITGARITSGLPSYVAIVRDRLERRKQVAIAERLKQQAEDLTAAPRKASMLAAEALVSGGTSSDEEPSDVDIAELGVQWAHYVERLEHAPSTGLDDGVLLRTGIELLDEKGDGMPSNLCVLLGLASMGKTALAAQIIWNWLRNGIPGGIVGLEEGTKWLTRRHLARHLGIPVKQVGRTLLHEYQMERLDRWMEETADMYRKHLRLHRAGGLPASDLLAIVNRWIRAGVRWVWIDHGLRVDYGSADQRRYDLAIGKTLEALATLGERHGVVIAVNWHLNRTSDPNARPTMAMAKESGYLEAAARWMLAIWEQPQRPGMLLGTALKVTEGPRDWTVALERDPEHALVKNTGGYVVDFEEEAREAKERAEAARASRKLFGGAR